MSEITAHFNLLEEKVHSVRYQEVDANGTPVYGDRSKVGGLYVRKSALTSLGNGGYPPNLKVVISVDDD